MKKSLFTILAAGLMSFSIHALSMDGWGSNWVPMGTPYPGYYGSAAPGAVRNRALDNMCLDGYNYDNAAARRLCARSGYPMPGEYPYYPGSYYPGRLPTHSYDPADPSFRTDRERHGRGGHRGGF